MATPPRMVAAEPKQARAHATRRAVLDAAVAELLEHGYAGLTTPAVAHRAGVSRGAMQNWFPHKATLVTEAVRHLGRQGRDQLMERVDTVPRGRARVQAGLDVLFEQYSGPLFAAVVELSLATRGDAELRDVIAGVERDISRAMQETATIIFGEELPPSWATVLSTIRGLALLRLLGHPEAAVDHQWVATRRQLLELLT